MANKGTENFDIEDVKGKAEEFLTENKNVILGVTVGIIVIVGGILAYINFVSIPKELSSQEELWAAQHEFERDSFALALEGNPDSEFLYGLSEVSSEYSGTNGGMTADYLAGISYMKLGEFDNAISHLKHVDFDDEIIGPLASVLLGDCYSQNGDYENAYDYYIDGADDADNELVTPYALKKAAIVKEELGDHSTSLELYKRIKNEYPNSQEARGVDKNINYCENMQ